MIFVTLGSQKFQFSRLLKYVDDLMDDGVITEDVFAQTCVSDYVPKNYKHSSFIDKDAFNRCMDESRIIITHGGTATIINAIKLGKKVIAVPRLEAYNEHVDDHQVQIVNKFDGMGLIYACNSYEDIKHALSKMQSNSFNTYTSNTDILIDDLDNYIETIAKGR